MRNTLLRILCIGHCALCINTASAQDILAGVEFSSFFDNREYAPLTAQESFTSFSGRLTPWVGLQWKRQHRLVAGVGLRKDYGRDRDFMSDFDPHFYYQFNSPQWTAHMGVFDRKLMEGRMSDMVYDEWHDFFCDHILGAHGAWRGRNSHVELAVSWEGQPTEEIREKFRVLSTAQRRWQNLYMGYDFALTHLANDLSDVETGVVDFIQVMPYVGVRFNAFFGFDLRATWAASIQRDRRVHESHSPNGGMFGLTMSRWGASLDYQFYGGKGQQPFRNRYADLLYTGNPLYASKTYHRTTLAYGRAFADGTVHLDARFAFHADGHGLGTEQMLTLGVRLEHLWKTGKHHKKGK